MKKGILTAKQIEAIEKLTDTWHSYINGDIDTFNPNKNRGDASRAFYIDKDYHTGDIEIHAVKYMWIKLEWLPKLYEILNWIEEEKVEMVTKSYWCYGVGPITSIPNRKPFNTYSSGYFESEEHLRAFLKNKYPGIKIKRMEQKGNTKEFAIGSEKENTVNPPVKLEKGDK